MEGEDFTLLGVEDGEMLGLELGFVEGEYPTSLGVVDGALLEMKRGVDVGEDSTGTHSPSTLHIPAAPSCKFKKS